MRPADLPPAERFEHGTRARYVSGCRCEACRRSLREAAAERARQVRAAVAEVLPNPGPPIWKTILRTAPSGARYEVRQRACPGTGGAPCVAGGSALRSGRAVCLPCVDRAAVWNGTVDAAPVRKHLRRLARAGVGYKSVAAACDVAVTVLGEVLYSGKRRVRRRTADRVLAVTADAVADGGRVDAAPTWALIGELLEAGLTKGEVATRLGMGTRSLQLSRTKVRASTALAVRRLHAHVVAEAGAERFPRDPADARFVDPGAFAEVFERFAALGLGRRAAARRAGVPSAAVVERCTPETLRKLRAELARLERQAEVDARAAELRRLEEEGGARAWRERRQEAAA